MGNLENRLELDDPTWGELHHAYGPASDIPELLRQLSKDPSPACAHNAEPWFSLWSSLCHQHDVYSASYAALPHLVAIGLQASGPIDFSFYLLPASIEIARHSERGPQLPDRLASSYFKGVQSLKDLVCARVNEDWDQSDTRSALCALAVAKGDHSVGEALAVLDNDLIDKLVQMDF